MQVYSCYDPDETCPPQHQLSKKAWKVSFQYLYIYISLWCLDLSANSYLQYSQLNLRLLPLNWQLK